MNHVDNLSKYVYNQLTHWFNDFKAHEVTSLVELIQKSEALMLAAEAIPEEKCKQFLENFTYDLQDFYQQYHAEVKHSLYVNLLQENFWRTLADITDKSQVEWIELQEDIAHKGEYRTGDMIGFGILVCTQCHHSVTITHLTQVGLCECGSKHFHRQMLDA